MENKSKLKPPHAIQYCKTVNFPKRHRKPHIQASYNNIVQYQQNEFASIGTFFTPYLDFDFSLWNMFCLDRAKYGL